MSDDSTRDAIGRFWDENLRDPLERSGVPEAGLAWMREVYIVGARNNAEALKVILSRGGAMNADLCACGRPIGDASDLANDRAGVCYDLELSKTMSEIELATGSRIERESTCLELQLAAALGEAIAELGPASAVHALRWRSLIAKVEAGRDR